MRNEMKRSMLQLMPNPKQKLMPKLTSKPTLCRKLNLHPKLMQIPKAEAKSPNILNGLIAPCHLEHRYIKKQR
jgi:hypothetical protein